MSCKFWLWTSF